MFFLNKNTLSVFFIGMITFTIASASYDVQDLINLSISIFSEDETSQQVMQFGVYDYSIVGNTLTLHNPYLEYRIGGNSSELILIPFNDSILVARKLCMTLGFKQGRVQIEELDDSGNKFEHDEIYVSNQGLFKLKNIYSFKKDLIITCSVLH